MAQSWVHSIEQKADSVYSAGVNLITANRELQDAQTGDERNTKEAELESAYGRFLEAIAPGIATEPTPTDGEGGGETESQYIADEGQRKERYQENLGLFLNVARDIYAGREGSNMDAVNQDIQTINEFVAGRLDAEPIEFKEETPAPAPDATTVTPEDIVARVLSIASGNPGVTREQALEQALQDAGLDDATTLREGAQRLLAAGSYTNDAGTTVTFTPTPSPAPAPAGGTDTIGLYDSALADALGQSLFQTLPELLGDSDQESKSVVRALESRRNHLLESGMPGDTPFTPSETHRIDEGRIGVINTIITDYDRHIAGADEQEARDYINQTADDLFDVDPDDEVSSTARAKISAIGEGGYQGFPDETATHIFFKYATSRDAHKHLSNHALFGFTANGHFWHTLEHYFQAMKFPEGEIREKIKAAATAGEAWRIANENIANEIPDVDKDAIMWEGITRKYSSTVLYDGMTLADMLVNTEGKELVHIEHLTTGMRAAGMEAPYWGVAPDATGSLMRNEDGSFAGNRLGEMLMEYREYLLADESRMPQSADMENNNFAITHNQLNPRANLEDAGVASRHLFGKGNPEILRSTKFKVGIIGSRVHRSAFIDPESADTATDLVRLTAEQNRALADLAVEIGLIETADQFHPDLVPALEEYNDAIDIGRDIGAQVGGAVGRAGYVTVSGGAVGTDRDSMKEALSEGGEVIGAYPDGIQRRIVEYPGGQTSEHPQYSPNFPGVSSDGEPHTWDPKYVGVSLHQPGYIAKDSAYGIALIERNGVTAGLSDVVIVTAADSADSGTVDTAHKALNAGRPVVVVDPSFFPGGMEGNASLVGLDGVYVMTPPLVQGEGARPIDGDAILEYAKAVWRIHNESGPDSIPPQLREYTKDFSDHDFELQIIGTRAIAEQEYDGGSLLKALAADLRTRHLIRLKAEKQTESGKASSVEMGTHTPLTPQERAVGAGTIGLNNFDSFDAFYNALTADGDVDVFVDTRQNPWSKERHDDGRFRPGWKHGQELNRLLAQKGVQYVRSIEFAPTVDTRLFQANIHEMAGVQDLDLDATYIASYYNQLVESGADLGLFVKEMIGRHIGYENVSEDSKIIFACVEPNASECHRSLLGGILSNILGMDVSEMGGHTHFNYREREAGAPPTSPLLLSSQYSKKVEVNVGGDQDVIPQSDMPLTLSGYDRRPNGAVSLRYRSYLYPGWEVILEARSNGTTRIGYSGPGLTEVGDIAETGFGETTNLPLDALFAESDKPAVALKAIQMLSAARANPTWFTDLYAIEPHPDDATLPNTLAEKRVGVGVEYREIGETKILGGLGRLIQSKGQYAGSAETGQNVNVVDPTENTRLHYKFTTPSMASHLRVRMSENQRYLEAATVGTAPTLLPAGFPPRVAIMQDYAHFAASRSSHEEDPLWEYLISDPRIDMFVEYTDLRPEVRDAVYPEGFENPQQHWDLVRSFMVRANIIRDFQGEHVSQEERAASYFALNMPPAPSIPTQAYSYLAAIGRESRSVDKAGENIAIPVSEGNIYKVLDLPFDEGTNLPIGEAIDDMSDVDSGAIQDWLEELVDQTPGLMSQRLNQHLKMRT